MMSVDELKAKQLEILHELDRVCNTAGIQYYLAYGSLLGAVRHKGFIPWDDDIDVVMTYPEMQKLLANRNQFGRKYFLQCRETEAEYNTMKYSIRDSSTSFFSDEQDILNINHGIDIDIYILYPYPDNFFKAHKLIIDSFILRLLYLKRMPANHGIIGRLASKLVSLLYSGSRGTKKIQKVEDYLRNNGGKRYYSVYFGYDITPFSCLKFPQESFEKPVFLQFEDFMAPCPLNPEKIFEISYGKKYMQFPPEEKRISNHHILFMSCDEPYTKFEGKYYNINH